MFSSLKGGDEATLIWNLKEPGGCHIQKHLHTWGSLGTSTLVLRQQARLLLWCQFLSIIVTAWGRWVRRRERPALRLRNDSLAVSAKPGENGD